MPEAVNDAVLLEAFVSRHEDDAFMELVRRHGPLVESVCRRVLRNEHDVADAFQGTFVVLARRADAVLWCDSVGGWLGAVARRLALSIRSGQIERFRRERGMTDLDMDRQRAGSRGFVESWHPMTTASDELERLELRQAIDAEIERLPYKYRAAVVLCDLEGLTHHQAAKQLGWPAGSLSRRLGKARSILRHRLASKGLALGVIGVVAAAVLWGWDWRGDQERVNVRRAMTSFGHGSAASSGLRRGLEGLTREPDMQPPNQKQAQVIGREAVAAALALKSQTPGESSDSGSKGVRLDEWRNYAKAMEQAAERLVLAGEAGSPAGIVAAARRLETSCVMCHRAFRIE